MSHYTQIYLCTHLTVSTISYITRAQLSNQKVNTELLVKLSLSICRGLVLVSPADT
jgi:hypothetical protein